VIYLPDKMSSKRQYKKARLLTEEEVLEMRWLVQRDEEYNPLRRRLLYSGRTSIDESGIPIIKPETL